MARHRREEVNLDTGERRSWVEEQEFEVMDLTGTSPPKAIPSTSSRLEKTRNPLDSMMAIPPKTSDVGTLHDSTPSNPTVQTLVRRQMTWPSYLTI